MKDPMLDNQLLTSIMLFQKNNPHANFEDMKKYWIRGHLLNEIDNMPVFDNQQVGLYQNSEINTEIVRSERTRYKDVSTLDKQFE